MNKENWTEREKIFLYYTIKFSKTNILLQLLLAAGSVFFKKYTFQFNSSKYVFYKSIQRDDYDNLFNTIYNQCNCSKTIATWNYKIRINFSNIYNTIIKLKMIKELKYINLPNEPNVGNKRYAKCNILDQWILFFRLIERNGMVKSLEKSDFTEVKAIFVLCDVWEPEQILINYANSIGKVTITGQHGLFIPNIADDTYDVLNYWNIPSKYQLAWGVETQKALKKYSPKTISCVCGNPLISRKDFHEEKKIIGIIMDIPRFDKYNQKMINIAELYASKNNLKVRIRLHPTDIKEKYIIDSKISEFNRNIDICFCLLGHTSTMICSYMSQGKKVFKLKSNIKYLDIDEQICFDSLKELEQCMSESNQSNFNKMVKRQIYAIDETSKMEYKKFFNNFEFKNNNYSLTEHHNAPL